ncbi:MAG TPA: tetratricopeptide repeat protein, partial [Magnetospirillaceae bacterium]|nr:tetratricopeptide repeat protein [Magnetospirillaceae bacterium]
MMRFPCARASRGRSLHHCAAASLAALAALLPVAANADRADTLLDAGRLVQARAAFMQILSSRPNDVPALVGLARTEYALGHERAADELLVHAHALAPGDQDVERLREERDRYADAIVAYQFGWGNGQTWHLARL